MPKVTFMPGNRVCEARDGDSLLEVALNHDVPLMHACGGFCACTTCHVWVRSGGDKLSEMEEAEQERVQYATGSTEVSRLSCQTKVHGDVVVEIVNQE